MIIYDFVHSGLIGMFLINFSSAFDTVVPSKLVLKLRGQGRGNSTCKWLSDFLTGRPRAARIGNACSSTLALNTRVPQGGCFSPLPYSLFTYDYVANHNNRVMKYANDTTVIGLISNNDESAYWREVEDLSLWCHNNNLFLNVSMTK